MGDKSGDVGAGSLAAGTEGNDLPDLTQPEPDRLRRADEGETVEHVGVVVAVARGRAPGPVEDSDVLVEADRLDRHPGAPSHLTDAHGQIVGLDPPVNRRVDTGHVDVTLLYFDGCPNWTLARHRLQEAMRRAGLDEALLTCRRVATPEEAQAIGFAGSPTIWIDGRDPFGGESALVGFACRLYQTPAGPDGAPSADQLLAVLAS